MTKYLLPLVLTAAVLAAPALAATEQGPTATAWPTTVPGSDVLVVTLAQPGKRRPCELGSLTPDALTCVGKHGRKPAVYKPAEVEALISPRYEENLVIPMLSFLGAGGAIIYAATLLNPFTTVGAVVVGIFGGLIACTSGAFAIGANGGYPDRLLYLAPGHTLSVKLRR
jgi:hypothetical protein